MRPEHHGLFIELLRTYMPNADVICEILGYKYRYFVDAETPRSLYIITALLLQFGLIKLNEIYKWVSVLSSCSLRPSVEYIRLIQFLCFTAKPE